MLIDLVRIDEIHRVPQDKYAVFDEAAKHCLADRISGYPRVLDLVAIFCHRAFAVRTEMRKDLPQSQILGANEFGGLLPNLSEQFFYVAQLAPQLRRLLLVGADAQRCL